MSLILPTDEQASETAIPIGPDDEELAEAPSEHIKRCHNLHSQILQRLEELRDDQRDYVSLRRERWGLAHDIPQVARKLWESDVNAWAEEEPEVQRFWINMNPGHRFLRSLVPDTANLLQAKFRFESWVNKPGAYLSRWNKNCLANTELTNQWPNTWKIYFSWESRDLCCEHSVIYSTLNSDTYSTPNTSSNCFEAPFNFDMVNSNQHLLKVMESNSNICGVIAQFSVSRSFDVIDLNNAAAIISLARGNEYPEDGPEFLDGHIAEWQERSVDKRCGTRLSTLSGPGIRSHFFMHYMRSFIVVSSDENATPAKPHALGLKCLRDHISFRGFYNDTTTKLVEKRYSTALGLLPLQKPAGHYVLVSICDGQDSDTYTMFRRSPGSAYGESRVKVWKRYGIYPAGLHTGMSMFQLQICVMIDSWEKDWASTIKRIDEMVSLNFDVLENDTHLRDLVLGDTNDDSVLYFKVLQILNSFSDMVRAAPSYLDTLWPNARPQIGMKFWKYPHKEDTENIVRHNWEIVSKRQHDASDRILKKLERTSNEVKSLQNGLFNVQSILEARKSRVLNKYLLVFTVVTILFLPPTFVATFFGMHIFDADTINTTRKVFWTVLGALSGGTYLIAAFGLFGSNLSADQRKEWATYVRARVGALGSRLQLQQIGEQRKEWTASLRARVGVLILELLLWTDSFIRLVRNRLRLLFNVGNRQPGEQV